jgi:sugar lactone lactonase YvrE
MRSYAPSRFPYLITCVAFVLFAGRALGQGRIMEPVEAFYGPASSVFSPDGRTLYVSNSARTDYGMVAGRGAISRVSVGEDGSLKVTEARLVDGLNAPIGVTLLPVAVGDFPKGTLVVAVGGRWTMRDRNTRVTDPRERETGLLFFDPSTGTRLGAVYLGTGSTLESVIGHPMMDPSHVVFDGAGNCFVADVAGLGLQKEPGETSHPGIVRMKPAALVALARGEAVPTGSVEFQSVPEVAGGIAWYEKDRMFYWATGPGFGDLAGAVLRLQGGDFGPGGEIETVHKEIFPMIGACITANGSLIVAHTDGVIGVIKRGRGKVKPIKFKEREVFISPGQPSTTTLADGRVLVVVPEMASGGRPAWRHRLQLFTLPSDY